MERSELLEYLAGRIIQLERPHPVRVAIDGPDAAGKSTLADELVTPIEARGRPVIRASVDNFHYPRDVRYKRGDSSAEGYYYDSFNYQALTDSLLDPLGPMGSRRFRSTHFDFRTDAEVSSSIRVAEPNSVLLFDGVFLLRRELIEHWDFTIFVDAEFENIIARAEQRDTAVLGSTEEVRRRYKERYIPGQKLYYAEARPVERASVVVDNNNPDNPLIRIERCQKYP